MLVLYSVLKMLGGEPDPHFVCSAAIASLNSGYEIVPGQDIPSLPFSNGSLVGYDTVLTRYLNLGIRAFVNICSNKVVSC